VVFSRNHSLPAPTRWFPIGNYAKAIYRTLSNVQANTAITSEALPQFLQLGESKIHQTMIAIA